MFYTIYRITNKINGRIYIGKHQTTNLDDGYMGSGKLIKQAIKKYGAENFSKEILFILETEVEMNEKEIELVTEEFCLREDTYNMAIGGRGSSFKGQQHPMYGKKHSSEAIEKMRVVKLGKSNGPRSDETKAKISKGHIGKKLSNETKKKLSAYSGEKSSSFGKPLSASTKQKISAKNSGGKHGMAKSIVIDGVSFQCLNDAAKFFNVSQTKMSRYSRGLVKSL